MQKIVIPLTPVIHRLLNHRALSLLLSCVLAGCAGLPESSNTGDQSLYKCANAMTFSVLFVDDTAVLDGTARHELLYRDAGGQGELQSVYSNRHMRAEFGLGASGKEAVLHDLVRQLDLRCVRP